VSGDVLYLAVHAAMHESGATKEEAACLLSALRHEQQESPWPKGFMPEL